MIAIELLQKLFHVLPSIGLAKSENDASKENKEQVGIVLVESSSMDTIT